MLMIPESTARRAAEQLSMLIEIVERQVKLRGGDASGAVADFIGECRQTVRELEGKAAATTERR